MEVNISNYKTVIIATPLWWSQMATNMQTFLFKHGSEMAGKNVGLIVSSHSSGISGVESNAKRLVPKGQFKSNSLWINANNHANRMNLLKQWLKDNNDIVTSINDLTVDQATSHKGIYTLNGQQLAEAPATGIYIENGIKKAKF